MREEGPSERWLALLGSVKRPFAPRKQGQSLNAEKFQWWRTKEKEIASYR